MIGGCGVVGEERGSEGLWVNIFLRFLADKPEH
jgi:hypothetical protein